MRIAYLNYHYDIIGTARGAAAQIHAIAAGLERLDHQVDLHFRTAKKSGEEYTYGGLKRIGWLRCYGHVPRLLLRNLLLFRQECQIFDAFRPEVVLAVSSFCNLSTLLAARSRRLPFVLFSEAPLEYEYSMFFTQYYSYPRLSRWVEGVNVRGADQVTCISEVLKGYLLRYGVPATKLHLVPNGVDHHAFQPQPADQELQTQFHLQERVVVGFVGSFNFFAAVEAFANMVQAVCAHQRQVVFLFVGRGKSGEQLRRTGERRGLSDHLLFAGAIDHEQVPRYLSVMDIMVCPYRGDYLFYNSSMKLLEYMAMGKATLATAQGQNKEVVHDGYNGMLLEPGDMVMMEHKLLALIKNEDLRRQLGSNARRTIEDQWTWDIQVSRLVKVLQLAVEGRR